jgi:hypothetical protein
VFTLLEAGLALGACTLHQRRQAEIALRRAGRALVIIKTASNIISSHQLASGRSNHAWYAAGQVKGDLPALTRRRCVANPSKNGVYAEDGSSSDRGMLLAK